MSFFDSINPFKKKDEFSFDSGSSGNNTDFSHPNIDSGHNFDPGSFAANPPQPLPQDDHRMTMPLGENIRQKRVQAIYGGDEGTEPRYPEQLAVQHNPLQKELELISSKLDYLKASLDAVNQRLVNLEHLTKHEMENNPSINNRRW